MSLFSLEAAQENVKQERPSSWHYLDAPWSPDSRYPVKVLVNDGGGQYGAWGEAYGEIREKHGEKVKNPGKQKKLLNLHSVGQLPVAVQRAAEKNAIRKSQCVLAVAYVGPSFGSEKDLDLWCAGKLEVMAGGKTQLAPSDVKEFYADAGDGWKISESVAPPEEWIDTEEGLDWFLTQKAFCGQVAVIRARLEDESGQQTADEVAEKNSGSGPTTKAQKGDSTKPTGATSRT